MRPGCSIPCIVLLLAACAQPGARPKGLPVEEVAGHSVRGQPIHYWLFGDEGPVVYFIALIDGDATAGTPILADLLVFLLLRPHLTLRRRALVVPMLNPDGVERGKRGNANGADLARDASQPESRALHRLMERYPPALVVILTQPEGCVRYDAALEDLARRMAGRCGLPARRLLPTPDWDASTVELALPRSADRLTDLALWQRYGPAAVLALLAVG